MRRQGYNAENLRIQVELSKIKICDERLVRLQPRLEELLNGVDHLDELITSHDEPAIKFVRP